eukprot:7638752-Lingulodinium_polyedra.AAC.1
MAGGGALSNSRLLAYKNCVATVIAFQTLESDKWHSSTNERDAHARAANNFTPRRWENCPLSEILLVVIHTPS